MQENLVPKEGMIIVAEFGVLSCQFEMEMLWTERMGGGLTKTLNSRELLSQEIVNLIEE